MIFLIGTESTLALLLSDIQSAAFDSGSGAYGRLSVGDGRKQCPVFHRKSHLEEARVWGGLCWNLDWNKHSKNVGFIFLKDRGL